MPKTVSLYRLLPGLISLTDWIFPPHCVGCGIFGITWCETCRGKVSKLTDKVCNRCGYPIIPKEECEECKRHPCITTSQRSFAEYQGGIRKVIHHLKFQNGIELGYHFRFDLADIVRTEKWKIDAICPVPQSASRRKERGYNQATMLGWPLAQVLGVQFEPTLIKKVIEKTSQITQNASGRLANISDAFHTSNDSLKGKSILIVDDVITTGSTMNECAKVCFEAGAVYVYGLSLARSIIGNISA